MLSLTSCDLLLMEPQHCTHSTTAEILHTIFIIVVGAKIWMRAVLLTKPTTFCTADSSLPSWTPASTYRGWLTTLQPGGGAADRFPYSSDYFRLLFLDPNDLSTWIEGAHGAMSAVLKALRLGLRPGSHGRAGCLLLRQLQRAYTSQELKVPHAGK